MYGGKNEEKKLILIPILFVLLFIIYKQCLILYYKDLNSYATNYDSISVKTKKAVTDKNLCNTKIDNLNIYIPDGFKNVKSKYSIGTSYYVPNDEKFEKATNYINISDANRYYDVLYKDDKRLQTIGAYKLMKSNNINSEFDLIKYYYNKRKKNSIFTSKNDIKMNYLADICVKNSILNSGRDLNYYLEGDLQGLMVENDNYRYIKLYDKGHNKYYSISISKYPKNPNYKEILTKDEINKIVKSIYFD